MDNSQASGQALGCLVVMAVGAFLFYQVRTCGEEPEAASRRPSEQTAAASPASPPPPERWVTVDKSPAKQKARKKLIGEMLGPGGLFTKIVPAQTNPHMIQIGVTRRWMRLSFEDKEKFGGLVYAYFFDGSDMEDAIYFVDYHDSRFGKDVGSYGGMTRGFSNGGWLPW